ncbi:hypothetical protein NL676_008000 [Syzygium grande]|nr:hypothetical protein NL676_008000 [Syzygium grande]
MQISCHLLGTDLLSSSSECDTHLSYFDSLPDPTAALRPSAAMPPTTSAMATTVTAIFCTVFELVSSFATAPSFTIIVRLLSFSPV